MSGLLLLLFLLAVASLLFFTRLTVCTIAISRQHQNFWRWCFSCRLSWKFSAFLGWGAPVWIKKKNKKYYLPSVLAMPVLRSRPGSGFTHSHLESISSDGNEAVHVVQNLSDVFGWQNPLWLRHRFVLQNMSPLWAWIKCLLTPRGRIGHTFLYIAVLIINIRQSSLMILENLKFLLFEDFVNSSFPPVIT